MKKLNYYNNKKIKNDLKSKLFINNNYENYKVNRLYNNIKYDKFDNYYKNKKIKNDL